jgi:hypothetical protein
MLRCAGRLRSFGHPGDGAQDDSGQRGGERGASEEDSDEYGRYYNRMSVRFILSGRDVYEWREVEPDGGVYGVFSGDGVGASGGAEVVCRSAGGAVCWGWIEKGGSGVEMGRACFDRELVCGLEVAGGADFGDCADEVD